jgi:hypothetical protein
MAAWKPTDILPLYFRQLAQGLEGSVQRLRGLNHGALKGRRAVPYDGGASGCGAAVRLFPDGAFSFFATIDTDKAD